MANVSQHMFHIHNAMKGVCLWILQCFLIDQIRRKNQTWWKKTFHLDTCMLTLLFDRNPIKIKASNIWMFQNYKLWTPQGIGR